MNLPIEWRLDRRRQAAQRFAPPEQKGLKRDRCWFRNLLPSRYLKLIIQTRGVNRCFQASFSTSKALW